MPTDRHTDPLSHPELAQYRPRPEAAEWVRLRPLDPDSIRRTLKMTRYTSNKAKRQSNLRKHGFDLVQAEQVLNGPGITKVDSRFHYDEVRYATTGLLGQKVVVVVYTERGGEIRVISIRKATGKETQELFAYIAERLD